MKLKILLTGGTGFVGSHLAEKLLQAGFDLFCTTRKKSNLNWINHLNINKIEVDWESPSSLEEVVEKIDFIIHCAGVTKALTQSDYYKGNVLPTLALLNASKNKASLKRFIFISTQAATGPSLAGMPLTEDAPCYPITDYGKSKLEAEKDILKYQNDFPVTILRPCSIYGPRDHEFFPIFNLLKYYLILLIENGLRQFNMIYIKDFVEIVLGIMQVDHPSGSLFFAGGDQIYDMKTLCDTAQEVYHKKALKLKSPLFVLKILGQITDLISKITHKPYLLNSQKVNELLQDYWLCDSSKIEKLLNFTPRYILKEGFKETLNWYQKEKWL